MITKMAHPKPNKRKRRRRRFPGRENLPMLKWLREQPCEVCLAAGLEQWSHTEVEHWVTKARGGYDLGDTFPTCGLHRRHRHSMGDLTFQAKYPQRVWSEMGAIFAARRQRGDFGATE